MSLCCALGRSWGIDINVRELKIINDINDKTNKLKSNLINYLDTDGNNRTVDQKSLKKSIDEVFMKLTEISFWFRNFEEPIQKDLYIPVDSIYRKLRSKYSRQMM